jgi:hypothetical protein
MPVHSHTGGQGGEKGKKSVFEKLFKKARQKIFFFLSFVGAIESNESNSISNRMSRRSHFI